MTTVDERGAAIVSPTEDLVDNVRGVCETPWAATDVAKAGNAVDALQLLKAQRFADVMGETIEVRRVDRPVVGWCPTP